MKQTPIKKKDFIEAVKAASKTNDIDKVFKRLVELGAIIEAPKEEE